MRKMRKEITVKRVSAFKFEIELSVGVSNTEVTSVEAADAAEAKIPDAGFQNRISVIRKAPPSAAQMVFSRRNNSCDRRICNVIPDEAILIKDAILYRIIEILLWALLGENYLSLWGYPTAPTYRLLWKLVYHFTCLQSAAGASAMTLRQDHDCQGDINCFMDHVGHFLELCAPTQELKEKFRWSGRSCEEILRMIYNEDLLPLLGKSELSNHPNILNSYKDILRLQEWQSQGFTAMSWNGHEHFSRLRSRFFWCSQCSRGLRKSAISC